MCRKWTRHYAMIMAYAASCLELILQAIEVFSNWLRFVENDGNVLFACSVAFFLEICIGVTKGANIKCKPASANAHVSETKCNCLRKAKRET